MDFLLLIFYLARYFKILRKSENGSKTKMDFFRTGVANCANLSSHLHHIRDHHFRFPTHTHLYSIPFSTYSQCFMTESSSLLVSCGTIFPVLDLLFISGLGFSGNFSRQISQYSICFSFSESDCLEIVPVLDLKFLGTKSIFRFQKWIFKISMWEYFIVDYFMWNCNGR